MTNDENNVGESRSEKYINLVIIISLILLAIETWKLLDEKWNSLHSLPVYIYAGVLFFYLLTERVTYRGSGIKGKQSRRWTRYLLLFFWWVLIIAPVLEYTFYPRYNFAVTIIGITLTVFGTGLRAWSIWTLGEYFSAHIEIKNNHKLVESGPYKFIRHPAYSGNIMQALGIPLILNAYLSLSISAVLIILFLFRIQSEEDILIQEVNGYRDYLKRTYRLIPKIW
jgi:protein-S-isoprenylcysteine O-methyltransferase Ste14